MSSEFITKRKTQLNQYLKSLCENISITKSKELQELLIPPELVKSFNSIRKSSYSNDNNNDNNNISISDESLKSNQSDPTNAALIGIDFQPSINIFNDDNNINKQSMMDEIKSDNNNDINNDDRKILTKLNYITKYIKRKRRYSFPSADHHLKYRNPPPMQGDWRYNDINNELKINDIYSINSKDDETLINNDNISPKNNNNNDNNSDTIKNDNKSVDYSILTPALVGVLDSFLSLTKRDTISSAFQGALTTIVTMFINGPITKLLNSKMSTYLIDDTISSIMKLIVDSIWPNGTFYTPAPLPTNKDINDKYIETRKLITKLTESDKIPHSLLRIVGDKHIKTCIIKFYRFTQQPMFLKHLMFGILDNLWTQLFPKHISRRDRRNKYKAELKQQKKSNNNNINNNNNIKDSNHNISNNNHSLKPPKMKPPSKPTQFKILKGRNKKSHSTTNLMNLHNNINPINDEEPIKHSQTMKLKNVFKKLKPNHNNNNKSNNINGDINASNNKIKNDYVSINNGDNIQTKNKHKKSNDIKKTKPKRSHTNPHKKRDKNKKNNQRKNDDCMVVMWH